MGIRFFNPFDLVDFRDHNIRQRSFIMDTDKHKNVRLAKAGMSLLDTGELLE